MAAVLYWRLSELTPTKLGPLPWLPGISPTLRAHPVWGPYLAKRSHLVANLADQIQDHACQGDTKPVWAAPGSHPSAAFIGEIAVWRAANGINPQTRDQPAEPNSERSLPCGNNASTGISRVPPTRQPMRGPTSHRQHPAHSVQGTKRNAPTKSPNGDRAGRQRPADGTPQASSRGTQNMRLHSTRRWQGDGRAGQAAAHCRIRRFQIKGRASPGRAACVLASLLGRAVSCSSGIRTSAFIRQIIVS
jgi:hypothetical protein